jgi:pimeloyl-ACP methyl ester carboxylesterase
VPDLDRDGVRISYQVFGPPDGATPLLLTHGFSASSAMWQPNIAALAAARPVITWDLRGHGRSDAPDDLARYCAEACVADMATLLDACGIARVVAGGLSLGGYLSLEFCLAHPDRVAGLVLCDTGPGYRRDEPRQRWNDRAIAIAERLEHDPAGGLAGGLARGPAGGLAGYSARGLARAARGMLTQRDARVINALPGITIPALVLVGGRDQDYLGAAEYMAAKLPRAVHAVIPEAGHMCNADQPGLFSQQVLAFLDQPGLR